MGERTFLVVVDRSPEMTVALRYAAWRARQTGDKVALLYVIKPLEIQPWSGVDKMMLAEAVAAGKAALRQHEEFIERAVGTKPTLYIRRGAAKHALFQLLEDQPDILVLVMAASTGPKGPGPLVSYLTSASGIKQLKIPLVIVPDIYKFDVESIAI